MLININHDLMKSITLSRSLKNTWFKAFLEEILLVASKSSIYYNRSRAYYETLGNKANSYIPSHFGNLSKYFSMLGHYSNVG